MKWIGVFVAGLASLAVAPHSRGQYQPTPEQRFFDWTALARRAGKRRAEKKMTPAPRAAASRDARSRARMSTR